MHSGFPPSHHQSVPVRVPCSGPLPEPQHQTATWSSSLVASAVPGGMVSVCGESPSKCCSVLFTAFYGVFMVGIVFPILAL